VASRARDPTAPLGRLADVLLPPDAHTSVIRRAATALVLLLLLVGAACETAAGTGTGADPPPPGPPTGTTTVAVPAGEDQAGSR
jgi:hypothetical protein